MQVKNLCFSYEKHQILKNITFSIPNGKITTVLGCNGSGKSTLFSLMTKTLTPNSGEILLENQNIKNIKLKEFAKKVSIVNQVNSIQGDLTVRQLVGFGRIPFISILQQMSKEDDEIIERAMEMTGIIELQNKPVSNLSGGQMQRIWIALSLAQNTKILFLDEPTTFLDIKYQKEILELIKKLNQKLGITIIMVLHDINQAIKYSDMIIGLKEGEIVAHGNPKKIITEKFIEEIYDVKLKTFCVDDDLFVKYV